MSKYYYHGMGEAFCHCNSLERVLSIFKKGGIKCKRLLNLPNIYESTCNGMDYVSICKKLSKEEYEELCAYEHAFPLYVENCFCLIVTDEIDVIEPIRIPLIDWNNHEVAKMRAKNRESRFTDMCDEWQVEEEVPLSAIIGVGIPLQWIEQQWTDTKRLEKLAELVSIIEALGLDIVDTNNPNFVEEYEEKKAIVVSEKNKVGS